MNITKTFKGLDDTFNRYSLTHNMSLNHKQYYWSVYGQDDVRVKKQLIHNAFVEIVTSKLIFF